MRISPGSVDAYLRRALEGSKGVTAKGLLDHVTSDLPLRENRDLFGYILTDPSYWFQVNSMVIDLVAGGEASVTDLGGTPLSRIYVERTRQPRVSGATVRLGRKENSGQLLRRVDCIAD